MRMANSMRIHVSILHDDLDSRAASVESVSAFDTGGSTSFVISVQSHGGCRPIAFDEERLARIVGGLLTSDDQSKPARFADRIPVRQGNTIVLVRPRDVDWIEAQGNYVLLHTSKAAFTVRDTIGGIEGQLDPSRFRRVHRSTIVNVEKIRELRPQAHGDYRVVLEGGTELTLSRSYRSALGSLLSSAG